MRMMKMNDRRFYWRSCPSFHPTMGFMCSKPLYHTGKCLAEFSNTTEKVEFDFNVDSTSKSALITLTESAIKEFGLEKYLKAYSEVGHSDKYVNKKYHWYRCTNIFKFGAKDNFLFCDLPSGHDGNCSAKFPKNDDVIMWYPDKNSSKTNKIKLIEISESDIEYYKLDKEKILKFQLENEPYS